MGVFNLRQPNLCNKLQGKANGKNQKYSWNEIWIKMMKHKWLKCCRGALLVSFMFVHGGHQPLEKIILELTKTDI